ncbi:TPA: type II secretion system F family protein [Salmonella enterica subsp. enterica serovar Newport]|nr:protein dehydratase [Salmonella enterica]EEK2973972.1 protein dehydratase [Salmonella enterica]EFB7478731.1 protein dehydratase [Salmonella enterica subsp. enterica serovar Newport]EMD2586662.1 type II secretion system F family protein [Salmonella enterica]
MMLIVLGTINMLAFYIYLKKIRKLRTELVHREILLKRENKNIFTIAIAKLLFVYNDFSRKMKSVTRGTKLNTAIPYFLALISGMYLNIQYIKVNNYIAVLFLFLSLLFVFYKKGQKRLRSEFEDGFSEALNIINSALSSGNTILHGIDKCGERIPGIVGEEFRGISRRLSIGEEPQRIFYDSYEHLPYREYYFFILAVLININGGGQVKEVMSRLSKLITDGKIMDRKKYAMTAEARMSVKVLACIPVGFTFILKVLSPENFDILINDPTGQWILYYAIASILFGLFIVWNMMNKAV